MYIGVLIGMVGMVLGDTVESTTSPSTCIAPCASHIPISDSNPQRATRPGFVGTRRSFKDEDWYVSRTLSCKASAFGISYAKSICKSRDLPWARKEDFTAVYVHGSVQSISRVGQRAPKFITVWSDGTSYERDKNFVHDSVFEAINRFGAKYGN